MAQTARSNPIENYVTVAERIERFYEKYPEGRIITHIVEHDAERGFILMRAEVYRQPDDALPAATGHAFEYRDAGHVQRTSYIETGETSAVGRALALCGFEVKRGIASREEMQKVERMQGPRPVDAKPASVATSKPGGILRGQAKAIERICDLVGVKPADAAMKTFNKPLADLTEHEAGQLISELQGKST